MNKYGVRIRELRDKKKDTLEDLARKLNMTASALGKYERGERRITPELLEKIASIYDIPVSYFYGEELPDELKKFGEGWVTFAKDMQDKKLTPEQIRSLVEMLEKLGKI